jgi:hypothetical protein
MLDDYTAAAAAAKVGSKKIIILARSRTTI